MMQTVPNSPLVGPQNVLNVTSGTTMGVAMNPLYGNDTGGTPILSYVLEMDPTNNGAGPFQEIGGLTTYSLLTQYTISNLTSGQYYYFRYSAIND